LPANELADKFTDKCTPLAQANRDIPVVMFDQIGTGSSGATIRMYVEQYVPPEAGPEKLHADAAKALEPLVNVALTLSKMKELTGRDKPTVIT
jgi:phosphoglucomutase